jgi:hypothetical protein
LVFSWRDFSREAMVGGAFANGHGYLSIVGFAERHLRVTTTVDRR